MRHTGVEKHTGRTVLRQAEDKVSMNNRPLQFVILPPPGRDLTSLGFRNVRTSRGEYDAFLAEMQRLRGKIYLQDGAIQGRTLTADRRHKLPIDDRSWHILTTKPDNKVSGCLRFLEERGASRFDELCISHSALARCPNWGERFRRAVECELEKARLKNVTFGEVGGWALAEDRRCTVDPLRMVLAACGLFRLMRGCIGLATATVRHGSAAILRRLGLTPLGADGIAIPAYYDPLYGCHMEALRFDSDFPNPKYAHAIENLCTELISAPVICSHKAAGTAWSDLEGVSPITVGDPQETRHSMHA
jgi:hypothetical protein